MSIREHAREFIKNIDSQSVTVKCPTCGRSVLIYRKQLVQGYKCPCGREFKQNSDEQETVNGLQTTDEQLIQRSST